MVAVLRSSTGASRRLLLAALRRRVSLLVSVPLMLEYEAVLTRRVHMDAAGVTGNDIATLLDAIAAVSTPVRPAFLWRPTLRPTLRDTDDDMVLEVAVNGGADALVTFNGRDFALGADRFDLDVWTPARAWQSVERVT